MKIKAFMLSLALLLMCFSGSMANALDGNAPQEAALLFNKADEIKFKYHASGETNTNPSNTVIDFGKDGDGNSIAVESGVVIIEADYMVYENAVHSLEFLLAGEGQLHQEVEDAATGESAMKETDATRFSAFSIGRSGTDVAIGIYYPSWNGSKFETKNARITPKYSLDTYNHLRIICDIDNDKYYLQVNGEDIEFPAFEGGSYSFEKISGIVLGARSQTSLSINNLAVYTADSIDSFVSTVDETGNIAINFSEKMDVSTISQGSFALENTTHGESVGFTIVEKQNARVVIKPNILLGDNSYKLSSNDSLKTTLQTPFATVLAEFSTKPEEIIDSYVLKTPQFSDGVASVEVRNNSSDKITQTLISALYEKLSDGNETFISHQAQEILLDGESEETYTFSGYTTEETKDYVVRFFLWDSVNGKKTYAKSVSVNGEDYEEGKVYKTDRAEVSVTKTDVDRAYVEFKCDFKSNNSKRLTYVITNPNGAICFIGQAASDESGIAESKMRFKQGTPSGTYTINYKADGMAEDTCTFNLNMEQAKPTAVNVTIEGEKVEGEYLKGNYEYFHIGDIDENESSYSWYICDTANGEFSAIENVTGKTLLVTQDFVLKYVRFGVTAKTETVSGTEVLSEPVKIYASPIVSDVEISGDVKVGNTISASYKTYHPEGAEVRVNCRWLLAEGDNYTEISTQKSLDVSQSVGQKIVLEVTPVIDVYPYTGKSVLSAVKSVKAASSSVGPPSGGGGGGVVRPPVQEEPPTPVVNDNFNDVPKDYWAYENIKTLSEKNIIKGKGEGNFAPEDTVTRAEFVAMIVRALNLEQSGEVEFLDVNEEDWYYSAINVAASLKIISGHDGSFRPLSPITREEMAVIISNACNMIESEKSIENEVSFTDASEISSWAKESIAKMVDAKILTGFEDGSFRGQSFSTRAQSATVICRLLGL